MLSGMPVSEKTKLLNDVQSTDYLASVRFTHHCIYSYKEKLVIRCFDCQTVREDARLILLQESSLIRSGPGGVGIAVSDKANALVALSVLRGKEGLGCHPATFIA